MKKTLLLLLIPGFLVAQTHFIDTHILYMNGNDVNNDITINTYYNSIDTCDISWSIISDSMPSGWEFSICFPNCHNIRVVDGTDLFLPNEKSYLNCHMYPNGVYGQGIVRMEIITNNTYRDTVTWHGQVYLSSDIESSNSIVESKLIKITYIFGRDVTDYNNRLLFYIYSDGKIEKKINLK